MSSGPEPARAEARVSVVIVSYNTRDDLLRCLASLSAVSLPLEVVVVDNASADGSPAAVRQAFPAVRLMENPTNEGYSRANNRGWRATSAPLVLLLNSDTELSAGALEVMAGILDRRPDVGIVGPRTVDGEGVIQVSTGPDLAPLLEWRQRRLVRGVRRRDEGALAEAEARHGREHEPTWVSGSCLLVRRTALVAVDGLDEAFFLYEEDVDLCVRVRSAGFAVLFTPAALVLHRLGRSVSTNPGRARIEYHRSHLYYYRKHHGPFRVALLRAHLAGLGLAAVLRSLGTSPAGPRDEDPRRLLGLALGLVR